MFCVSCVVFGFGHVAAWVPFFDDMDAIIFLAPISCFDQVLAEDNTVNRLVRFFSSPSNFVRTQSTTPFLVLYYDC